jgi:hypothetical protein
MAEALIIVGVAVNVVFWILMVFARGPSMETRQVVKWAILLALLPGLGVLGYFFWRLENAIQRGTPGRQDESASFLRSPGFKDK